MKFKKSEIFCFISFLFATLLASCGGVTPVPLTPSKTSPISPPEPITPTIVMDSKDGVIEPENVYKLHLIDKWGKGNVYGVAISPDETEIAVSMTTGVYIYNYNTLQEQQFIDLPIIRNAGWGNVPTMSISFSPDGNFLALGYENITIWNLAEGKIDKQISNRITDVNIVQIAYSPQGNTIAVMSTGTYAPCDTLGGNFALYNVASGDLLYNDFFCPESALFHFRFLTNGNVAFVGITPNSSDWIYKASIVDGNTGSLLKEFNSKEYIDSISMDGSKASIRTANNTKIIDINTQKPIDNIEGLALFLPENQNLLVNTDKDLKIISSDHKVICEFESLPHIQLNVYRSAFNLADNKLIFYDVWNQNVEVWDTTQCKRIKQLYLPHARDYLTYSDDGRFLVTTSLSNILILNGENGNYKFSISGNYGNYPKQDYDFGGSSNIIAAVRETSLDNPYAITFWDTTSGRQLESIQTEFVHFDHLSIVSGKTVIATQDKQGLHFWDIKSHNSLYTIPERYSFLYFNSEKDYFAVRDRDDGSIIFRNIKDGSIQNKIFISDDYFSVVFSKDWTFMAIEKGESIELWDINGNKLREFIEYTPIDLSIKSLTTSDIKFSPNNNLLVAIRHNSENYILRVWDTRTGNILRDVIIPFRISTMEFSPDGKKLTLLGEGVIYVLGVNESQ